MKLMRMWRIRKRKRERGRERGRERESTRRARERGYDYCSHAQLLPAQRDRDFSSLSASSSSLRLLKSVTDARTFLEREREKREERREKREEEEEREREERASQCRSLEREKRAEEREGGRGW